MFMIVTSMLFAWLSCTVVLRAPDCIHFSTHEDTEGKLEARQQKREKAPVAQMADSGSALQCPTSSASLASLNTG